MLSSQKCTKLMSVNLVDQLNGSGIAQIVITVPPTEPLSRDILSLNTLEARMFAISVSIVCQLKMP